MSIIMEPDEARGPEPRPTPSPSVISVTAVAGWFSVALFSLAGCVERKLTLRTEPSDARVFLDHKRLTETTPEGEVRQETPLTATFKYYGPRTVTVEKDGYRTLDAEVSLSPPFYEYPVIDLLKTFLWPFPVVDEHVVELVLTPAPETTDADLDALLARGGDLRKEVAKMKKWRWTPVVPDPKKKSPEASLPAATGDAR